MFAITVIVLPVLEIDSSSIEILLAVENPKVTSVFPPVTKVFPVNVIEAEVFAPVVIDEIVALVRLHYKLLSYKFYHLYLLQSFLMLPMAVFYEFYSRTLRTHAI